MVTERTFSPTRRRLVGSALGGLLLPWGAGASAALPARHWVTAWNEDGSHRVGLLQQSRTGWRVASLIEVPTRAHGLQVLADGSVIAVARRPGDWLLRWWPSPDGRPGRAPQWCWAPAGRQFNGHAVLHPDGRHLLLTATDTEADDGLGRGLLMQLRLDRLEPVQEVPTLGRDPHQLRIDAGGPGLWVANGGIASRPETGRARLAQAPMDASVALIVPEPGTGHLSAEGPRQRWTLADPWLSLRHLAWHAPSQTLGVAMQAEHPRPADRRDAPVLALLRLSDAAQADPAVLRSVAAGADFGGYGGDIVATADGFSVSSPRTGRIGHWSPEGHWRGSETLAQGCALEVDSDGQRLQAAGDHLSLASETSTRPQASTPTPDPLPVQPDNHWQRWTPSGRAPVVWPDTPRTFPPLP